MRAHAKTSTASVAQIRAVPPTPGEAKEFIETAESRLLELWTRQQRAQWVQETFITSDTEEIAAEADELVKAETAELAAQGRRFEGLELPEDVARKLRLLKLSVAIPAPRDRELAAELSQNAASLQSEYGRAKWQPYGPTGESLTLDELQNILATSRDPKRLLSAWEGWHSLARPMRKRYARMVELANQGAHEMGFADVGAMWRSNYDMPSEAFARELERLWQQVRPLYVSLHAYVRRRLAENYGPSVVPEDGPIPAHLLGNMWAQSWDNIYPLAAPPDADPGYDLTEILKAKNIGPVEMVRFGERFFLSLGFAPLPTTFWERSMFTRPKDRDVVCHASAWDIDFAEDLRIKMCIEPTAQDFSTIHHELGHTFYQRAYDNLPPLFRNSANDGFHEAIGDTIALSVTPEYLAQVGLLESVAPPTADIGLLLIRALDKIAFLPFGLLIDKWRWGVFSGAISPADYNRVWWDLRREYQGVAPPMLRSEDDFDPGAKYHIPGNVPYARYFLAAVLQFQFHRALCRATNYRGPLHRGSIFDNRVAGEELNKMLEMGQSRPWPEALEALTGETEMDATAMLDYFCPLKGWLDEQNRGYAVGW
jgi:peptidyl-dipeptidase A